MYLTQTKPYFLLLIVTAFFFSCNKAKRDKWILADINAVSYVTGEPVECDLTMFYQVEDGNYSSGSDYDSIALGATENGYYRLEKKFDSRVNEYYIRGEGKGEFYAVEGYHNYAFNNDYSADHANPIKDDDLKLEFLPIRHINVHLNNNTCNGANDTVWVSYHNLTTDNNTFIEETFTGCLDGSQTSFSCWSTASAIDFIINSKKNGVEDSFVQSFTDLQVEGYTDVTINY